MMTTRDFLFRFRLILLVAATACVRPSLAQSSSNEPARWLKGNLHTHSLWSDGDNYPEMIVDWYKQHHYDFLALSDHNTLLVGQKWTDPATNKGGPEALKKYVERFGTNWVEQGMHKGKNQVRLKTLEEFRGKFEEPDKFLLIPGEEISDRYLVLPIHLCISNPREYVPPQHGSNVTDVLQNNVNAVLEQRARTGQPMIPHINHPNFGWALTAEDIMPVKGEKFFEVYNGHWVVRNYGDKIHASTERIWDIILTKRIAELGLDPIWGTGVDDAHDYFGTGTNKANPGRGWVMVRSKELSPAAIINAMEAGDFYASSGVRLKDVKYFGPIPSFIGDHRISIEIEPEAGVTYTTQFIGTRKGYNRDSQPVKRESGSAFPVTRQYSDDIGTVLAEVKGPSPSYTLKGDEIYVRAKVISSKLKVNPYAKGDTEMAWIQPFVTGVK